ncbi:unnamed protein product [Urochloa humidicola]
MASLDALDPSHGQSFSAKVRSTLGSPLTSPSSDDASSFWLLASFSRSRLRLDDFSVSRILLSVLGGSSEHFSVVEVDEHIFKFTVFDKSVGLAIYRLRSFECPSFRVFFTLWNEKGISLARELVLSDRGPCFEWVQAKSKRYSRSYAEVVQSKNKGKLDQANVPVNKVFQRLNLDLNQRSSVFSRLDFSKVPDSNLRSSHVQSPRVLRPSFTPVSNLAGNGGRESRSWFSNSNHPGPNFLSGANAIPLGRFGPDKSGPNNGTCARCFSTAHDLSSCTSRVRCAAYYTLGHIAILCRFSARSSSPPQGFFSPTFSSCRESVLATELIASTATDKSAPPRWASSLPVFW